MSDSAIPEVVTPRRGESTRKRPARPQPIRLFSVVLVVGMVVGSALVVGTDLSAPRGTPCRTCVLGDIDAGWGPTALAYDSANGHLLVADAGPGGPPAWGVTIVNGSADRVLGHVSTLLRPGAVAYDPRNGDIYLAGWVGYTDNITVLNDTTGEVVTVIPTVTTVPWGGPYQLAYDPVNGVIDVLDSSPESLVMINGSTNRVSSEYNLPEGFPAGLSSPITVNPVNGEIYVATRILSPVQFNLTAINGWNGSVESSVQLNGTPEAFAFDAASQRLYVATSENGFPAFNNGSVIILNGTGAQVLGSFPVGIDPVAVSIDSSDDAIYVANSYSNNITVVNATNDRSAGSIGIDPDPETLVYDGANRCLYVLYYVPFGGSGDGYVSVIAPPGSACPALPSGPSAFPWGEVAVIAGVLLVLTILVAGVVLYLREI